MKADGINVTFTDEAIEYIAEYAEKLNKREQIGARRLWEIFDQYLIDLYLLDKDTVVTEDMLQDIFKKRESEAIEWKQKRNRYTKPAPQIMYI